MMMSMRPLHKENMFHISSIAAEEMNRRKKSNPFQKKSGTRLTGGLWSAPIAGWESDAAFGCAGAKKTKTGWL